METNPAQGKFIDQPIVIYHGGCDDGFGAAYAAWKAFGAQAEYYPGVYQEDPPDTTNRDVFLLDFSYKLSVLERILAQASSVTIFDHHKTARDDIEPLIQSGRVGGVFDMERSGAMITWQMLHPKTTPPPLMHHIQDRDLWHFKLTGTREIIAALRSYPQTFELWDELMHSTGKLLMEGRSIVRYEARHVEALTKSPIRMVIGGLSVPVVNAPWFLASDIAGTLAEGEPFAAVYWDTPSGRTFSLRSKGLHSTDVAEIARQYGGGGHRNSAGFKIQHEPDLSGAGKNSMGDPMALSGFKLENAYQY
jgi:oligoribonuclease NrnB/cAMP/cGMP phosphodiesterase (DHH superfamily)